MKKPAKTITVILLVSALILGCAGAGKQAMTPGQPLADPFEQHEGLPAEKIVVNPNDPVVKAIGFVGETAIHLGFQAWLDYLMGYKGPWW